MTFGKNMHYPLHEGINAIRGGGAKGLFKALKVMQGD